MDINDAIDTLAGTFIGREYTYEEALEMEKGPFYYWTFSKGNLKLELENFDAETLDYHVYLNDKEVYRCWEWVEEYEEGGIKRKISKYEPGEWEDNLSSLLETFGKYNISGEYQDEFSFIDIVFSNKPGEQMYFWDIYPNEFYF